ncbi:hypothetical protein B0H16DRAFT_1474789 [Mycena metata]|uniref:Uncharacterized protein n=1 Tax=Mycena metata TaxID=1033252 RepID=A0AAD7HH18_9AGAR|nr:hypothetical protein B0H16DRAFT_1474789 [Mycena metata]
MVLGFLRHMAHQSIQYFTAPPAPAALALPSAAPVPGAASFALAPAPLLPIFDSTGNITGYVQNSGSQPYSVLSTLWGAITIKLSDDPIRMTFDQSSRVCRTRLLFNPLSSIEQNTVGGKPVILSPPRTSPGRIEHRRIKEAWPCLARRAPPIKPE